MMDEPAIHVPHVGELGRKVKPISWLVLAKRNSELLIETR